MDRLACACQCVGSNWVLDTSSIFPFPRLWSILLKAVPESLVTTAFARFHSLSIRSLPALLAVLLHSAHTDTSVFAKTSNLSLIVIDDLSTPILATYPPGFEDGSSRYKSGRKEYTNTDSSATKRINLLKELASKLASLALKRNIAVFSCLRYVIE